MIMDEFIRKYLNHAIMHAESTLSGDYQAGNTSATEIEKMNQYIAALEDDQVVHNMIDGIIKSNYANATMWIAPVCKKKHYKMEFIQNKLSDYSKDNTLGILALNAAMLLKSIS